MIPRHQLTSVLAIVGALWAAALWERGTPVGREFVEVLPTVVGGASFVFLLFDRWLWRAPGIRHFILANRPVLQGTWEVEFRDDTKPGEQTKPIRAYMAIRQSFSWLSFRLMTHESASVTLTATILREDDGTHSIAALYRNTPKADVRYRSEIHNGAMWLQLHEDTEPSMTGHYWTDRSTKGSIEIRRRTSSVYASFKAAEKAFAESQA